MDPGLGPLVQFFLPRLTVGDPLPPVEDVAVEVDVDPLSGAARIRPAVEG